MSSDTWGSRSHTNRNNTDPNLTTTTITSLPSNPSHTARDRTNANRPNDNYRRHRRRSRSYSKSRSRSRSRTRSMNDSMSRSPSPKRPSNRHNDSRKSNRGNRYHRRPKRHTRELPYPSRSRSHSQSSKSRSPSHSRSPSYSNDSDERMRHRRNSNRKRAPMHNRYKHRHGHRNGNQSRNRHSHNKNTNNNGNFNIDNRGNRHMHTRSPNKHSHSNSANNNNNSHGSDKVPVSFKEFTNTMLEDDVTASEAQKRYEKYLQRFSKSDDVLFFEAHKDEEWFQERYDPIIIEKSIENRRENARQNYWRFYEDLIGDKLAQIHDNISDYTPVANSAPKQKREHSPTPPSLDTDTAMATTTTTTIIGSAQSIKTETELSMSDREGAIPRDGKLRLPKYIDIMYRDDYIPRLRAPQTQSSYTSQNGLKECYENSIFIQGIPLHIQREKILSPFSKCEGFLKLILSDPIRNSRKVRYGWVTFDGQSNCRKALKDVSEGGLNGHQLTGQYFMNLLPKQKSKRRPKFSPPESLYPHRVCIDLRQTLQCCHKFDTEAGISDNPLLSEKLLSELSEIRRLNLLLLYLRKCHFLCYYCGKHFLSEEHMYARCSGTHERKVPADITLCNPSKGESTNWESDLDQRMSDVISYNIGDSNGWIDRKQSKMLEKNSKRVSEGKFRCTVCSKLFKALVYVTKHIKNKHSDEIAKYIADQRLRTMFENYRRDRDRLTLRSFEDSVSTQNSKQKTLTQNAAVHTYVPIQTIGNHGQTHLMIATTAPYTMVSHHSHSHSHSPAQTHPERMGNISHSLSQHRPPLSHHSLRAPPMHSHNNNGNGNGNRHNNNGNGNRHNGNGNGNNDGRKIPIHFQEPITRTRRSYREIDVDYPIEEVEEEEIDYGFGDFVKNPTKFNL